MSSPSRAARAPLTRYVLPLAVFGAIALLLAIGLGRDPRLVPSPLVGKPLPVFRLTDLHQPARLIEDGHLRGRVALLNVWATWCVSCRQEHDTLMRIAREGSIPIFGLNYKDSRDSALRWLSRLGDPYVTTAFDGLGKVGLDLGVYGAPETYVIDASGHIAYKHIGPVTERDLREVILPMVEKLRAGDG